MHKKIALHKLKSFEDNFTLTQDLETSDYPYTRMKVHVIQNGEFDYVYNQVTDAKGQLHLNGKVSIRATMQSEAWLFDDVRQE